jgi:cell division protein ZapA
MEDGKLSIRVNIAERYYPFRIERKDEERVRKAVKLINEKMQEYRVRYSTSDVQDWFAMTCLHFAQNVLANEERICQDELAAKGLEDLERHLDNFLDYAEAK